jgi:hypothetical protein
VPSNPLSRMEFLVIGFDQRDASLTVVNSLGYSARNSADAIEDAQAAATAASRPTAAVCGGQDRRGGRLSRLITGHCRQPPR